MIKIINKLLFRIYNLKKPITGVKETPKNLSKTRWHLIIKMHKYILLIKKLKEDHPKTMAEIRY